MVRALAEPVAQQNVVVVVRVASAAGSAEDVLGVDARVVRFGFGFARNVGFVVVDGFDGFFFFFGDARGVGVRLRILQLFEQLADAELGAEDLRARLGDLGRGAEFLAAAFSRVESVR